MWNLVLLVVLSFALLLEAAMTFAGFFFPTPMLEKFGVVADGNTLFLGHIIAWFLLLVTVMIGYALLQVRRKQPMGWTVTRFLAAWWIPLGVSIYCCFGRPDNLFLDSAKGALLLLACHFTDPRRK